LTKLSLDWRLDLILGRSLGLAEKTFGLNHFLETKLGKPVGPGDWPGFGLVSGWGKVAVLGISGDVWEHGRFWVKNPEMDVWPILDFLEENESALVLDILDDMDETSGLGRHWLTWELDDWESGWEADWETDE
jgi:hypothetical protein